jgi:hypothetical protein
VWRSPSATDHAENVRFPAMVSPHQASHGLNAALSGGFFLPAFQDNGAIVPGIDGARLVLRQAWPIRSPLITTLTAYMVCLFSALS